ncbi:MAG: hypothetical protein M1813_004632 [Trichoglossum hirsutum]|nr:MAG: hypothetical protein M1813_004632 [Trichoglossum hirsutum]
MGEAVVVSETLERWWPLTAEDIDEKNLEYALKNVACNNLETRIKVTRSTPSGPLIPLDNLQLERYASLYI